MTVPSASYARGPDTPALLRHCIGEMLDRSADAYPERDALIVRHQKLRYSWRELRDQVELAARGLLRLKVQKGDRVGIWATNCTEWVILQFAAAKVGAILVNINPANRAFELEYVLRQSECQTLFLGQGFRDCDYLETLGSVCPDFPSCTRNELRSIKLPHLTNVIYLGSRQAPNWAHIWKHLLQMGEEAPEQELRRREATLGCDDPINIQYTSGTTGMPKGATLSHFNIVNNASFSAAAMKFTAEDRLCIPVPFYHCFGMVLSNMVCANTGAAMIIPAAFFDPLETLRAASEERCTALHGVPTMFIAELEHAEFSRFDLSRLRTGIMAGSPCPIEIMKRAVREMHLSEITIAYGLTEASPVITQTTTDDPIELRVTTVGKALPHTEAKIVDVTSGETLPVGTPGELCARGYMVMKGYYRNPDATRAAITEDGWLHTGDLATMDANGYFKITGRAKEVIIRGGENIYPRELEEFLFTCPGISEVQVVGVPDKKYGEQVVAWIKLAEGARLTAEDVQNFCTGKIASYKIPQHIRFVDWFPLTVTGKIQKFRMREISIEELKLQEAAKIETA